MLQIKFYCDLPAGLRDIHVWKCENTHAHMDARTPARVPSYKLTLWAFGSGELKIKYPLFDYFGTLQSDFCKNLTEFYQISFRNLPYLIDFSPQLMARMNFNQRTSGPVNAHLTPGPGIYFNAFIHVYSPRSGADNTLGTKFWWQQKGLFSLPICCKFQNDLLEIWFYTFLMILYMYIAPGQGHKTPWG